MTFTFARLCIYIQTESVVAINSNSIWYQLEMLLINDVFYLRNDHHLLFNRIKTAHLIIQFLKSAKKKNVSNNNSKE